MNVTRASLPHDSSVTPTYGPEFLPDLGADAQLDSLLDRVRRNYTRAVTIVAILLAGVGLVAILLAVVNRGFEGRFIPLAIVITFLAVESVILVLLNRGNPRVAMRLQAYTLTIVTILTLITSWNNASDDIFTLGGSFLPLGAITLISAATLTSRREFIAINCAIFAVVGVIFASILRNQGDAFPTTGLTISTIAISVQLLISFSFRYFISIMERAALEARRTGSLLEASADIGQMLARILNEDELLERAVDLVRDRFGYYHVQVFLVDDDERYALLEASTGQAGAALLARRHRLLIGSRSVIGQVTSERKPVVVRDTARTIGHAFNDLLPDTRSEIAVPILDGDTLLGALDVQSLRPNAFSNNELQALVVMANQIGTAIRTARLFHHQQQSVEENKRLFMDAENNLREIRRLNRNLTRENWREYLIGRERLTGVTMTGQAFQPGAEWTPRMVEATQNRKPVGYSDDQQRILAMPISLRGEVIGAIEVQTLPNTREDDVLEVVQAVADRLAVSLENARLFEETQEAIANEQLIGQMARDFQSAGTIDELLQVALSGIASTLGADNAMIRLGQLPNGAFSQAMGLPNGHAQRDTTHTDQNGGRA